jgi:hypothetical protein
MGLPAVLAGVATSRFGLHETGLIYAVAIAARPHRRAPPRHQRHSDRSHKHKVTSAALPAAHKRNYNRHGRRDLHGAARHGIARRGMDRLRESVPGVAA